MTAEYQTPAPKIDKRCAKNGQQCVAAGRGNFIFFPVLLTGCGSCGYNSILVDGEGTSLYYYYDETGAGSLEGEHRFKKKDGTHWQAFSTDIYIT